MATTFDRAALDTGTLDIHPMTPAIGAEILGIDLGTAWKFLAMIYFPKVHAVDIICLQWHCLLLSVCLSVFLCSLTSALR